MRRRRSGIARQLSELSARLGPGQDLLSVECKTAELQPLVQRMDERIEREIARTLRDEQRRREAAARAAEHLRSGSPPR